MKQIITFLALLIGLQAVAQVPSPVGSKAADSSKWIANGANIYNKNSGNVGIGTTAPTAKLEVAGQIKITGGTPVAGRVLTTDATGLGSWQPTVVPTFDATIDFSVNANPNTAGTTFNPNTPASTTAIYVSTIDGSQWTYNGTAYRTAPVSADWKVTGNAGTVQATNFLGTTDNVGLSLRTNNTIRQTITNNGNVGIGTTTPVTKLDVFGNAVIGIQTLATDGGLSIGTNILNVATPTKITTAVVTAPETALRLYRAGTAGIKWNPSADFQIGTYAVGLNALTSLKIRLGNNGTHTPDMDVMTLQGNGNVGIGTIAPAAKLHVIGSTKLEGNATNSGYIEFQRTGQATRDGYIGYGADGNGGIDINSEIATKPIKITTANGNVLVSTGTGNVGIGTTAPTQKLHVIGNILASGTITPSDKRLKSNIKEVTYGVSDLLKLKAVSYTKKFSLDKAEKGEVKEFGFLAQDLQKVLPELVSENGADKILAVNYTSLIPLLVKSIQELKAEIELLKTKIK